MTPAAVSRSGHRNRDLLGRAPERSGARELLTSSLLVSFLPSPSSSQPFVVSYEGSLRHRTDAVSAPHHHRTSRASGTSASKCSLQIPSSLYAWCVNSMPAPREIAMLSSEASAKVTRRVRFKQQRERVYRAQRLRKFVSLITAASTLAP